MADCNKHDEVIAELSIIKQRLSATETTVSDGWQVIRQNENRVSNLEKDVATTKERTESIFKLLESLTKTIRSIDIKLDELTKDIRLEIKETNSQINDIKKNLALNDYKTDSVREFMKGFTFGRMAGTALLIISIAAGIKTIVG